MAVFGQWEGVTPQCHRGKKGRVSIAHIVSVDSGFLPVSPCLWRQRSYDRSDSLCPALRQWSEFWQDGCCLGSPGWTHYGLWGAVKSMKDRGCFIASKVFLGSKCAMPLRSTFNELFLIVSSASWLQHLGGKSADQDMQIYTHRFGWVRSLKCSLSVNANYTALWVICLYVYI